MDEGFLVEMAGQEDESSSGAVVEERKVFGEEPWTRRSPTCSQLILGNSCDDKEGGN